MVGLAIFISRNVEKFNSALIPEGKCGKMKVGGRIVGGEDVEVLDELKGAVFHRHPWMARLSFLKDGNSFCGGTLISRRHVLTAAHCMIQCEKIYDCDEKPCKNDCKARGLQWITLGDYDRTKFEQEMYIEIENFVNHPKTFQPSPPRGAFQYDFSIVVLSKCVDFRDNIHAVCLPTNSSATYEGENVVVLGWGHLRYKDDRHDLAGKHSNILQRINITVFPEAHCKRASRTNWNPKYLMCAGDPITWNKDACQDDSGGK